MVAVGRLKLRLHHAKDLKDVQLIGKQDPYVVITLGDHTRRSRTHEDGGKNPVWDEEFEFSDVRLDDVIKLELWDANRWRHDKPIGYAEVCISLDNQAGEPRSFPVFSRRRLHRTEQRRGDVFVSYEFTVEREVQEDTSTQDQRRSASASSWVLPDQKHSSGWAQYKSIRVLGEGGFGKTHLATCLASGEQVAVKVISKKKLHTQRSRVNMRREVQILHHLAGHSNIVNLKDVFEDQESVYLVMELCEGGELFDSIASRGHYSEKDAAAAMRTILNAVLHCHEMGVMHRDLKPENLLLSDKTPGATLKLADFGLSTFFKEGDLFTTCAGTLQFMAPEVLLRQYAKHADVWSCGVILAVMLTGCYPFPGSTTREQMHYIVNEPISFQDNAWQGISEPAKDCVARMLQRDVRQRATAKQILQHDWLRQGGVASAAPIEPEVLARIRKYAAGNRLRKEAMKLIAANLPADEIAGLREIFEGIDRDHSGTITALELKTELKRKGNSLPPGELDRIMADADVNGDGLVDYEEFLAATIHKSRLEQEARLKAAFECFDLDGNGLISRDELLQTLSKQGVTVQGIDDIIAEVDKDGNGHIDYYEFCEMLHEL